ncbi:hypothetical protein [Paenibacillus humicus]|nr:hypothetical protein [Paenibacillus humicus]
MKFALDAWTARESGFFAVRNKGENGAMQTDAYSNVYRNLSE